jgi:hypothetical protein
LAKIPEDTTRYQKIPEVRVPSDLVNTVDTILKVAKDDPNLPQFKNRQAWVEYAVNRFLEKHSATPLSLEVPNGVIRFYREHEKWLQVNDSVDNFQEWLGLAIRSYTEATLDFLYKHDQQEELLNKYGLE